MADEIIEIDVAPRAKQTVTIRLGEESYDFTIPKVYGLVTTISQIQKSRKKEGERDIALFSKVEEWMFSCLSDKDADRIRERLLDPDDSLDQHHIVEVFQHLTKVASSRPSG